MNWGLLDESEVNGKLEAWRGRFRCKPFAAAKTRCVEELLVAHCRRPSRTTERELRAFVRPSPGTAHTLRVPQVEVLVGAGAQELARAVRAPWYSGSEAPVLPPDN